MSENRGLWSCQLARLTWWLAIERTARCDRDAGTGYDDDLLALVQGAQHVVELRFFVRFDFLMAQVQRAGGALLGPDASSLGGRRAVLVGEH